MNGVVAPGPAEPGESPADAAALAAYGADLAEAIRVALPAWVMRGVVSRCQEAGLAVDDSVVGAAAVVGTEAARQVGAEVSDLLALDIDEQRSTPLELLRGGVRFPTRLLTALGVEPVTRDEFARRSFPQDVYDLAPASFTAFDESVHEPGLRWGAAKAHVHLARHRDNRPS